MYKRQARDTSVDNLKYVSAHARLCVMISRYYKKMNERIEFSVLTRSLGICTSWKFSNFKTQKCDQKFEKNCKKPARFHTKGNFNKKNRNVSTFSVCCIAVCSTMIILVKKNQ